MPKTLELNIPKMELVVEGGEPVALSAQLFKVFYQFFFSVRRSRLEKSDQPIVYYDDIPGMTRGAAKVHMVDVKNMLPHGAFTNLRGEGYLPSMRWKWLFETS